MRKSAWIVAVALLAWMCVGVGVAAAQTTYFVRTSGNDSNNGRSAGAAFRTLQRALQFAVNRDIIYVGAGTYTGQTISVASGNSPTLPMRIIGDTTGLHTGDAGNVVLQFWGSGAVIAIQHDNLSFSNLIIRGGTSGVSSGGENVSFHNVTVENHSSRGFDLAGGAATLTSVVVQNSSGMGIRVDNGTDLVLRTSVVTGLSGVGVSVISSSCTALIERSTIFNLGGRGIDQSNGAVTVLNSVLYNNSGSNIYADTGSGATLVVRFCTLSGGNQSIALRGVTATVQNTIITSATTGIARVPGPPPTLTHNNNLYWSLGTNSNWTLSPSDVTGNPAFVNSGSDPYDIQATSMALGRGVAITGVTNDRLGRARPSGTWDIGAYEVATPAAPVPYFADFEVSVGGEWSVTNTMNATGITRLLGNFGQTTQAVLRVATTPGTEYSLLFDLIALDTWDGGHTSHGPDVMRVDVNGAAIWSHTITSVRPGQPLFTSTCDDWPERWFSNLGSSGAADTVFRTLVGRFTATGNETTLTFRATGLQGFSDESWAVDNVRVVTRAQESNFTPRFRERGRLTGFEWTNFTSAPSGTVAAPMLWSDVNSDGLVDSLQGGSVLAARLNGGASWTSASVSFAANAMNVMDFDNDGVPEIWRVRGSTVDAWRRSGSSFVDMPVPAATVSGANNAEAIAPVDVNSDGLIDLAILGPSGNMVAVNNGPDGSNTWTGFTMSTSVLPQGAHAGDGEFVATGDANNDGVPDLFYMFNSGQLFLSSPAGYARVNAGIAVTTGSASKAGASWGDYDNDGDLDLFVGRRQAGQRPYLWRNAGNATSFSDVGSSVFPVIVSGAVAGAWGDVDNDGDLDLAIVEGTGFSRLLINSGAPNYTFSAASEGMMTETRGGDVSWADVDNDGDLDLSFSSELQSWTSRLFVNQATGNTQYLRVRVVGAGAGGINRAGIGARVEVWNASNTTLLARRDIGGTRGMGGQDQLVAHFGGLNPGTAYTVRVYGGTRAYTIPNVVPGLASTTIGAQTITQMLTVDESTMARDPVVVQWREVQQDQAERDALGIE